MAKKKIRCGKGHRFTIANTRIDADGQRSCKTCLGESCGCIEISVGEWRAFEEKFQAQQKMLSEAVEIYQEKKLMDSLWDTDKNAPNMKFTHRALLINITPIKKESCRDVLRDLERIISRSKSTKDGIEHHDCGFNNSNPKETWDICERAKRALANEGE